MIGITFSSVCVLALTLSHAVMASPTALDQQFAKASSSFAGELYQKSIEGKTGNVIISPISVQSAVTLAMFGASGETKDEMLQGLKYPTGFSSESIAKNFEAFTEKVKATEGLKIANKVYVMKNFSVKKSFNDVATKSFASEAQSLDFGKNEEAAKTINAWVEAQTNNKIKDLIASDSLSADSRMVLVNAIYFKGLWTHQFKKEDTFKAPFHLNDKDQVEVDFMKIKEHFKYGPLTDLDATAIELPYNNSDVSMMIILPNTKTGLAALESKLNTIDLSEVSKSLFKQEVSVEIPKFKIEFNLDLNDALKNMGMVRMFDDKAEFNNLLEEDERLKVSKVVHKAFIEVNEEGAEAAAATGFTAFRAAVPGPRPIPIVFKANHPFIFGLMSSDQILFMGKIENFSG